MASDSRLLERRQDVSQDLQSQVTLDIHHCLTYIQESHSQNPNIFEIASDLLAIYGLISNAWTTRIWNDTTVSSKVVDDREM